MLSNLDLAESKLILKHTKMTRHNLVAFYCALTCGKNEIYVIGHRKIRSLKSETKFNQFLEENQFPRFTYSSLRGDLRDLVQNGMDIYLSFENRKQYIKLVRDFRLRELTCEARMLQIRAGLSTIIPLNHLTRLFTSEEAEMKICGQAKVDVEVLKKHTIYQVGLSPTEPHIQVRFR